VGAPLKRAGARKSLDEHLKELARLADTAAPKWWASSPSSSIARTRHYSR